MSFGGAMAQHTADIGVQLAAATYWGDINGVNYSKSVTPLVGVLGRWNFNKRMAVRGQLFTGNLKAEGTFGNANIGQSGTRLIPDLYPIDEGYVFNFNRSIQSVEALFEFNFRNYKLGNMKRETLTPFVSIGLGGLYSRAPRKGSFILLPQESLGPPNGLYYAPFTDLNSTKTNGYDVFTLTVPVGAGFKFNFTKRLGGIIEVIVRKTFSDKIDNLDDPKRFQFDRSAFPPGFTYPDKVSNIQLNKNDYYATLAFSLCWQMWSSRGNCAKIEKNTKIRHGH
jgi:hypothetical protein